MTASPGSFAGYVCWSADRANDVIEVDAASPSDAVFLATHQPMTIIQSPLRGDRARTFVDEEQLLAEFLKPGERMMLLPIVGGSGTGKSHLVRWIKARIGDSDSSRRVVYVPKVGTSLRGVIQLILEGMEGEQAEELKVKLREATQRLDAETAPSAVLAALADRIEFVPPMSTGDSEKDERRRGLSRSLPALLRDPFFRTAFFLRQDGVVHRFVDRALKGHRAGDSEAAFEFTFSDLQQVTYLPAGDASRLARDAQVEIQNQIGARAAAELLTENLGPAIQTVFGLEGAVSLTDVMMETRAVLAERGVELVLLIEDFTMLQGIQRELLDAVVEPPVRSGRANLCGIRVTLAVTTGYWDSLADTVRTRAGFASHVYDLNLPIQDGESQQADIPQFFSRYLNASRIGAAALETARASDPASDWVPNACEDCLHRTRCHDAFGEVDGIGLYPFNVNAIRRTTDAVTESTYFDPRAVLGAVLKTTLEEAETAIAEGMFPGNEYQRQYTATYKEQRALPADVVDELQRYPDPKRREALLTIWGGCPDDVVDLAPGIHEAFKLPEMGTPQGIAPQARPTSEAVVIPTPSRDDARLTARLGMIDAWAADPANLIDDNVSRELRDHLADSLWDSVDWASELITVPKEMKTSLLDQASFDILGAVGGRLPGKEMWTTSIERSAENAALFRGIVQYQQYGDWAFQRGSRALRIRLGLLDSWAADFVQFVRARVAGSSDSRLDAFRSLARDAAILGIVGSDSNNGYAVLNAALTVENVDSSIPPGQVTMAVRLAGTERSEKIRALLASLAARRGRSTAYAIETSELMPASVVIAERGLEGEAEAVIPTLAKELDALREVAQSIYTRVGSGLQPVEVSEAVTNALDVASNLGVMPGNSAAALRRQANELGDFDLPEVSRVLGLGELDLARTDVRALLVWIATQPRMRMKEYADFLIAAEKALNGAHSTIRGQVDSGNVKLGVEDLLETVSGLKASLIQWGGK